MKSFFRRYLVVLILGLLLFVAVILIGNSVVREANSLTLNGSQSQNTETKKNEQQKTPVIRKQNTNQNTVKKSADSTVVIKKIKDSRPDMSKANNSNTTSISRPAGYSKPEGAGKKSGVTKNQKK